MQARTYPKPRTLSQRFWLFQAQPPHSSRIFWGLMLAFLSGVGLAEAGFFVDYNLVFYWLMIFGGALVIFWREWQVWVCASFGFVLILGLAYPDFLGRGQLINWGQDFWLLEYLGRLRSGFEQVIGSYLPAPHSQLASGLLVGIQRGFSPALREAFIATGTIHIVAISGFNVTLVIKIFSDWIKGLGRFVAFWLGTLAVVGFVIIVGAQASVVRAGIMGWLFLLARLVNRQPLMINILIFSAVAMVIQEPAILTGDIGFQLSFGAMLGLIYISPVLEMGMEKLLIRYRWLELIIPQFLRAVLTETISAQLAVMPLIAYYFGRISPLSPIPNILILPTIIIPMSLGVLLGALGASIPILARALAVPLFLSLDYQIKIVNFFARAPFSQVYFKQPSLLTTALWCVIIAGAVSLLSRRLGIYKKL